MKITDLMDSDSLSHEVEEGYVRVRRHPWWPELAILNYTEKAQYERHWTKVTVQCRGLIYNQQTGEVLARPFDKFFNLGEYETPPMSPDAFVEVTDKMDGSLGICFPTPEGTYAIATRGSFESEQAIHATEILLGRYPEFKPASGLTYLFEIVYPENRIVCDYGDLDDLVLLGARDIRSGRILGPEGALRQALRPKDTWRGPVVETLGEPMMTFAEALELGDRTGREGIVIRSRANSHMVKVKQEDYVALHRLVTGLNERVVWEHLASHSGEVSGLVEQVPDEFHGWVTEVAERLLDSHAAVSAAAHEAYYGIHDDFTMEWGYDEEVGDITEPGYRRWYAEKAKQHGGLAPLLFQLLDGRDISPAIWKTLKPKGETPSLLDRTEDDA